MFEPNKWEQWHDSLPAHTKEYLKKQAVWNDRDIFKAFAYGALIGLLIGLIL